MPMKTKRNGAIVAAGAFLIACGVAGDQEPTELSLGKARAAIDASNAVVMTDHDGDGALVTVGKTPGKFAVTADGQASYSIPIWAPPGVMGLEPAIALRYNSAAGTGPMGV